MKTLRNELSNGTTARKDLSDERKEYTDYIYDMLVDNEILSSTLIDETDEAYQNGKKEQYSEAFLQHAINSEWVDISALDIASDYYSSDEIYNELIDYIINALQSDEAFDKILYKYMIKNGDLSGKRVCMLLFDQGVLNKDKDEDYDALRSDQMSRL